MTDSNEPPEAGAENRAVVGAASAPEPEPVGEKAGCPRHWARTAGAVLVVCAITVGVAVQVAGILLRDRVEHRVAVLIEPPPAPAPATADDTLAQPPSRLGADVREVEVGTAGVSVVPAPPPPPAPPKLPTAPPAPPEADPVVSPDEVPTKTVPPLSGIGLQVGIFRSQKYRKEIEDTLDRLGAPHFRLEATRAGVGFRLVVRAATEEARNLAVSTLDGRGVLSTVDADQVVAYFYMEEEAQASLRDLSKAGLQGGYGRFEGKVPLWTVLVGPLDEVGATRWEPRLHTSGLDTYRRVFP